MVFLFYTNVLGTSRLSEPNPTLGFTGESKIPFDEIFY